MKRQIAGNAKIVLTLEQIKALVKEARLVKEYEEVDVKSPSGDHLGCVDDEGNFTPGEYASDRYNAGEIIDDDGEYARQCGCFTSAYGYKVSKPAPKREQAPVEEFPRDKLFYGKEPKSESQAIYYLYQMVCIAQGKKRSPIAKSTTGDLAVTVKAIDNLLGITEPEISPDSMDVTDNHKRYYPGQDTSWIDARNESAVNYALKEWDSCSFDDYNTRSWPPKPIMYSFAEACLYVLRKRYDADLKELKKLLLDYYRTEKGSRSSDAIKAALQAGINKAKPEVIKYIGKESWEATWN